MKAKKFTGQVGKLSTKAMMLPTMLAMVLGGCGGGSGGGSSVVDAGKVPVAVVDNTTPVIISTVPASTYVDEDLKAFNLLNAERDRCGFGKLAQNAKLDVMAKGHANWLSVNRTLSHFQVLGSQAFTGVSYADRASGAGYGPNPDLSEVAGGFLVTENESRGIRGLLNAPYHELAVLRGFREVGIGITPMLNGDPEFQPGSQKIVVNYGTLPPDSAQTATANTVRTYPCDGSTGVERALRGEFPSPVPGRNLGALPLGTSIAVVGDVGKQMTITSATMTGPNGVAVVLRAPSNSLTDPNQGYVRMNEAYVSADAPLATSTTYQVFVTGTNGAMPFSRSFSFTTTSIFF